MSPFWKLDNYWSFIEDSSNFLQIKDYTDTGFEQNIFQLEMSPVAEAIFDERLLQNKLLEQKQDNSLSGPLAVSDIIPSPILEERTLEPCIHGGLQELSFNNCNEGNLSNCFGSWVNSREILEEGSASLIIDQNHDFSGGFDSRMLPEQEASALGGHSFDKGVVVKRIKGKIRERRHTFKRLQAEEKVVQLSEEDGSFSKKQEHNAKERVRRMKLNASYLALGALLPSDSRRKKNQSSAPLIIDRALDYIPELENEIEKLNLKKNNLLSKIDNEQNLYKNPQLSELDQAPMVSVHEVAKGEFIIQGCILKDKDNAFPNLLQNVEAEGMRIMSASTLQVCKERLCYHLHIQINGSSLEADYVSILREEIISWLR